MAGLSISREHIAELDRICENLAGDPHYPAAFAYVVDAEGVIFEKVVGEQDVMASDRGKVTADTGKSISLQHRPYANADSWSAILHLFSMPKSMIVVSLLQLVDQEVIQPADLDDPAFLATWLPELEQSKLNVLAGFEPESSKPRFRSATGSITVEMLLNHTSGLAYPFAPRGIAADLGRYVSTSGKKGYFDSRVTIDDFVQPLVFQPGTGWAYSPGLDFVGVLIERITKTSREDYMRQNTFDPLGLESLTFLPVSHQTGTLIRCCTAAPGAEACDGIEGLVYGKPKEPAAVTFFAGGGGLYGTARDYTTYLQALLGAGASVKSKVPTGGPIPTDAYRRLFEPSLPPPSPTNSCLSDLAAFLDMYHTESPVDHATSENVQFSLGLRLTLEDCEGRRRVGSGSWSGAARTVYWLDHRSGVAAFFGTQILDTDSDRFKSYYRQFERTLYTGLLRRES